jgi:hypothetical protein
MSAQVIRIFDRRRVAVNLGTADGLKKDERLRIYTPESEVVDPATGESLGSYRLLKATVYAREVFEKFCVAYPPQRREEIPIPMASQIAGIGGIFGPRAETKLVPGELEVSNSQLEPLPSGSAIAVGDLVERDPVEALAKTGAEPGA